MPIWIMAERGGPGVIQWSPFQDLCLGALLFDTCWLLPLECVAGDTTQTGNNRKEQLALLITFPKKWQVFVINETWYPLTGVSLLIEAIRALRGCLLDTAVQIYTYAHTLTYSHLLRMDDSPNFCIVFKNLVKATINCKIHFLDLNETYLT